MMKGEGGISRKTLKNDVIYEQPLITFLVLMKVLLK